MQRATAICALLVAAACKAPAQSRASGAGREEPASVVDASHLCASNATCASGEYCAFEPRLCGQGKRPGTCRAKPTECSESFSPVCGCDKKAHDSECIAHAAGVDLAMMGGCPLDIPDWSICGPHYCDTHTTYCEIVLSDVFELPTDYACKALPFSCIPDAGKPRDCSCFPTGTRCLSFCGYIDGPGLRGFHLTCRM